MGSSIEISKPSFQRQDILHEPLTPKNKCCFLQISSYYHNASLKDIHYLDVFYTVYTTADTILAKSLIAKASFIQPGKHGWLKAQFDWQNKSTEIKKIAIEKIEITYRDGAQESILWENATKIEHFDYKRPFGQDEDDEDAVAFNISNFCSIFCSNPYKIKQSIANSAGSKYLSEAVRPFVKDALSALKLQSFKPEKKKLLLEILKVLYEADKALAAQLGLSANFFEALALRIQNEYDQQKAKERKRKLRKALLAIPVIAIIVITIIQFLYTLYG